MLQDPVVLEYLQHGEANPEHNLFTSVAVIHSFATKCRNREVRRFVLGALVDAVRLGIMEKRDHCKVIGAIRSQQTRAH